MKMIRVKIVRTAASVRTVLKNHDYCAGGHDDSDGYNSRIRTIMMVMMFMW